MTQGKFIGTAENYSCNISSTLLKLLKIKFIFLILLACTATGNNNTDWKFDYFILSVRWLPTACIEYIEHNASSHKSCVLPENYSVWTIHGLWPESKIHDKFFCNTSVPFNLDSLASIRSDLELYWPNIEEDQSSSSLWKHEWLKHGTCSLSLTNLNTEFKYFNETLNKFKFFNINEKFKQLGVYPSNNGIYISDFLFKMKNLLGKNFHVHCINYKHETYLSAIQLCLAKNLTLINCDVPQTDSIINQHNLIGSTTNCPLNAPVIYPEKIDTSYNSDTSIENDGKIHYYYKLLNFLRAIQFFQWVFL